MRLVPAGVLLSVAAAMAPAPAPAFAQQAAPRSSIRAGGDSQVTVEVAPAAR
jgi:hypothetical protein